MKSLAFLYDSFWQNMHELHSIDGAVYDVWYRMYYWYFGDLYSDAGWKWMALFWKTFRWCFGDWFVAFWMISYCAKINLQCKLSCSLLYTPSPQIPAARRKVWKPFPDAWNILSLILLRQIMHFNKSICNCRCLHSGVKCSVPSRLDERDYWSLILSAFSILHRVLNCTTQWSWIHTFPPPYPKQLNTTVLVWNLLDCGGSAWWSLYRSKWLYICWFHSSKKWSSVNLSGQHWRLVSVCLLIVYSDSSSNQMAGK